VVSGRVGGRFEKSLAEGLSLLCEELRCLGRNDWAKGFSVEAIKGVCCNL
jgi:hypothetical protein